MAPRSWLKLVVVLEALSLLLASSPLANAVPVTGQYVWSYSKEIAVSPSNDRLYVCSVKVDLGTGGTQIVVDVVDRRTTTLLATIPIPQFGRSCGLAFNATTQRLYVETWDGLVVIDGTSNAILTTISFPTGYPGVVVDPLTNRIYVSQFSGVVVVDGNTNQVVDQIPVGRVWPDSIAILPECSMLYLGQYDHRAGTRLVAVNLKTNSIVRRVRVTNGTPGPIAINRATKRVYVAAHEFIGVFDALSNARFADIPQPATRHQIAIDALTNTLYSFAPPYILKIDAASGLLEDQWYLGPWDVNTTGPLPSIRIAVDPALGRVYATGDPDSNTLVVFRNDERLVNPSLDALGQPVTIPSGWSPRGLDASDEMVTDSYDDQFAFRMTGIAGQRKVLFQNVAASGPEGTAVTVEGFSKATDALPTGPSGVDYAIQVTLHFADDTQRTYILGFAGGTHDWQRVHRRIVAPQAFTGFTVRVVYSNQTGSAHFDSLHAWLSPPTQPASPD